MDDVPRIGLLGLMLELYDKAVPDLRPQENEFGSKLSAKLGEFAHVTWGGIANTRHEVERRMAGFAADDVDLIVVVHFSYAPSLIALPALVRCGRPVVLLNTQELAGIGESFTQNDMLLNHGMHGQQDMANTLLRAGKAFGVVTGHWEDRATLAEVQDWAVAAATVRKLRQAEIGRIGWAFQDMGDFGLDETDFLMKIGPHVRQVPLDLLADGQSDAPEAEVAALVADYRAQYAIAADLTDEELGASARAEWSVRRAVKELGLSGFSVHYEVLGQDPRFAALPFAAAARLLAEGVSFGGEGDVTSAAAVLMLHYLCGMATFSEMFTMDFAGGTVFMSHFAEGNTRMAKQGQPIQMVRRDGWVGSGGVSASLAFTFEPGPVTMTNLTVGSGGEFHLIVTQGEAIDFLVEGQPTPHCKFRPTGCAAHKSGQTLFSPRQCREPAKEADENSVCPDLCRFLSRYLELGGSHHVAVAPGDQTSRVRKCAKLMGLRVDVI